MAGLMLPASPKPATGSSRADAEHVRIRNLAGEVSHIAQLAEIAAEGGLYFDALGHLEAVRSILAAARAPHLRRVR